jgi:tRNA (guanosine-2'-O-)-methyltransferase
MPTDKRISKMRKILKCRQLDLNVVCENIHDPHNVSAILRTCDAVGVQNVKLLYTKEIFPKLGKKSSASAKKWIDTQRFTNPQELKKHLKSKRITIYATYLKEDSVSIFDVDWTKPSAVIFGNEQRGVSDEVLDICDQLINIPMFGMIESLNVSVAAAVVLYEATRQRLKKHFYPNKKLSGKCIDDMLQNWIAK